MTTDLETRPTVIDGEIVESRRNPNTPAVWITAAGVAATAAAAVHVAGVDPVHLNISVGATVAAIGLFLWSLGRHHAFTEQHP